MKTLEYGPSWTSTDIMRDIRQLGYTIIKAQQVWERDTLFTKVLVI